MSIRKFSTASISAGTNKSTKLWDQETFQSGMFALATVSLTSNASAVSFANIPSGYTHLQIRASHAGYLPSTTGADLLYVGAINDNTLTTSHQLYGDGATAAASVNAVSVNIASVYTQPTPLYWTATIIDILDYANTNKNKTIRSFAGYDRNGAGVVSLSSALYSTNTNAITSIVFIGGGSYIASGSKFALYGIKGA
jgi:hypothetical protein